jgi:hypothetical protein
MGDPVQKLRKDEFGKRFEKKYALCLSLSDWYKK